MAGVVVSGAQVSVRGAAPPAGGTVLLPAPPRPANGSGAAGLGCGQAGAALPGGAVGGGEACGAPGGQPGRPSRCKRAGGLGSAGERVEARPPAAHGAVRPAGDVPQVRSPRGEAACRAHSSCSKSEKGAALRIAKIPGPL